MMRIENLAIRGVTADTARIWGAELIEAIL